MFRFSRAISTCTKAKLIRSPSMGVFQAEMWNTTDGSPLIDHQFLEQLATLKQEIDFIPITVISICIL